jgi:hypothetical protein
MIAEKHPQIAAHEHQADDHDSPGEQAKACGNVH